MRRILVLMLLAVLLGAWPWARQGPESPRRGSGRDVLRRRMNADGSPVFRATNSQMLANGIEIVNFEGRASFTVGGDSGTYVPLNRLVVKNNSDEELTIWIDTDSSREFTILARDSFRLEDEWFSSFMLRNVKAGAGTVAAGAVEWYAKFEAPATPEGITRGLARKVF